MSNARAKEPFSISAVAATALGVIAVAAWGSGSASATTWVVSSPLGNSLRTNGEWRNERAIAALKSDGTVISPEDS
jgi:hypothetical protein